MFIDMELDATEPVTLKIVATDSEGNETETGVTDPTIIVLDGADANFGDLAKNQDGSYTFNPGASGAKGTIDGKADIDGVPHEAGVSITLKPGAAKEIKLAFSPVVAEGSATPPPSGDAGATTGDGTTPPADGEGEGGLRPLPEN